jgi:hypothetical protein
MFVLPTDGKCFVNLHVLASFHTTAAEDALIRVVPVKGIGVISGVGFVEKGAFLMLDVEHGGCVVYGAIAIVVVANSAIEKVVLQNTVESIELRVSNAGRLGDNGCVFCNHRGASANQAAVYFNEACITCFNRAELGMVANVRDVAACLRNYVDQ